MTSTLEIILFCAACVWALVCLVLLIALCFATGRPMPEIILADQNPSGVTRLRKNQVGENELRLGQDNRIRVAGLAQFTSTGPD
jgi:hypothetical protein